VRWKTVVDALITGLLLQASNCWFASASQQLNYLLEKLKVKFVDKFESKENVHKLLLIGKTNNRQHSMSTTCLQQFNLSLNIFLFILHAECQKK